LARSVVHAHARPKRTIGCARRSFRAPRGRDTNRGIEPGLVSHASRRARTIYNKAGNPVGTQSTEYQICTFKVKNTTSTFGCSRAHKNVPWVLQPGDQLTAEVFGATRLEVSAPLHVVS
jgi:hypothetical protein